VSSARPPEGPAELGRGGHPMVGEQGEDGEVTGLEVKAERA